MRCGNVQYWHNVHDEAPFFVPEETHEEDEEKSGLGECSDAGVLHKTNRDEQLGRHKKAREERRQVSPERRYLSKMRWGNNRMKDIPTPHSALLPSYTLKYMLKNSGQRGHWSQKYESINTVKAENV